MKAGNTVHNQTITYPTIDFAILVFSSMYLSCFYLWIEQDMSVVSTMISRSVGKESRSASTFW